MQSFIGKTALVVGGSGGIGSDLCRQLASKGCSLIVHGGRNSSEFDSLITELQDSVFATKLVQFLDIGFAKKFLTSPLYFAAKDADIICVSFGPFLQCKLHDMNIENWERMTELNLMFPGLLVSTALPQMMEKRWGRFLLFGGTRTERVNAFSSNAAYAAAKTAISSLVRSTALEYARFGITCNAVFPGFTKTKYVSEDICDSLAEKMPQKRIIESMEIAKMSLSLLEQPMVNGSLVSIDGGWDPAFL